jgi:uncharacterized membrane protein
MSPSTNDSAFSFYEKAAWISLFIAVFLASIIVADYVFPLFESEALLSAELLFFFGLVIGLIFGVISLIGFRRHRRAFTLWIASAGVLISGGLATTQVAFFISILAGFGHQ